MTTAPHRRLRRPVLTIIGLTGAAALMLSACAGGGGGTSEPEALTFLKNAENTTTEPILQALADGEC